MKIAFYAPLKAPDHAVPSGDRQMARLLIAALNLTGHDVRIVSRLRSYLPDSSAEALADTKARASLEVESIAASWRVSSPPGLWLSYHPYYKAPDLIGPPLTRTFGIPYVTAEASHSSRRDTGAWAETQSFVVEAIQQAEFNICFTKRDRDGLAAIAPGARLEMLAPYIDTAPFATLPDVERGGRLVTVAMMRKGDKFESFKLLAEALALLSDVAWTLTIIGDGPMRGEVAALFGAIPSARLEWLGEVEPDRVPGLLAAGGIYVWPGTGEAYGLAYLEAQAAGLPVVAQKTAGVPEVVKDGLTGILTAAGDVRAFASAIRRLLVNDGERRQLAAQARRFVFGERSLQQAAQRLNTFIGRAP